MNAEGDEQRTGRRPSIEERVARREMVDAQGRDRYDRLLRHLQAGREIALERSRGERWDWHPVAGKIVIAAVVVIAVYLIATAVMGYLRDQRVDTWTGPDATVTSGQRLDGCPSFFRLEHPVFPAWIRFDGGVFQRTDQIVPVGATNIGTSYIESGYRHDDFVLYTVHVPGLGEPGSRIAVRKGSAAAAEIYRRVEGCS
jgi:hypothetical protein